MFARRLVSEGLITEEPKARSKGGTRFAFRLSLDGLKLTDDQVRKFVEQSAAGMPLEKLRPLAEALDMLDTGGADTRGHVGEMLAVHACLMLGLRVVAWRQRAPVEIDLTAERTVALSYQRWHVQAKNTQGELDADRVDREIGTAAGTGATHLLFVVPRGGVTAPGNRFVPLSAIATRAPMPLFEIRNDRLAALAERSHCRSRQGVAARELAGALDCQAASDTVVGVDGRGRVRSGG